MPAKRKRLNRQIIASNLAEAIEELAGLNFKAIHGGLTEVQLAIGLQHAHHHLNFAWNIRNVPTTQYANLTDRQFKRWGKYPADMDEFLDPDSGCR
jgi:hypothetical protein